MIKNLVIVESPSKARKIGKFLGPDYTVMACAGHIRDLKKKNFGINIDKGFEPDYEIPTDKKALVSELKKAAKEAKMVWLASDADREGEAIAWHLAEVLKLKPETTRRIAFLEITEPAVKYALEHPRDIDLDMVNAQQARRVLDRIVGFELSPVLWKKVKPALSAGRVQSVAVRLIVEREKEIRDFVPEEYYRVSGLFGTVAGVPVKGELTRRIADEGSAKRLLDACSESTFKVGEISVKPLKRSPAPPFTTSTLQQEAARKLGFTVSQTMMVAQKLYENGDITYMRTDSLNLSDLAYEALKKEICGKIGTEYWHERHYHTRAKGAQEAHEAIRPTYMSHHTVEGSAQEKRLYALIWKRTMASQMADAEIEKTTVEILPDRADATFQATGEVIKFDGFQRLYMEGHDEDPAEGGEDGLLPAMQSGEPLALKEMTATQRFTQQPPRYTEASLVKKLEELQIGRPSTYATTITTIQQREYVERGESEGTPRTIKVLSLRDGRVTTSERTEMAGSNRGKLVPTDIGVVVNDFLTDYFPEILDYSFTAQVESRFDEIAEGKRVWNNEIQEFYDGFHPAVDKALNMRLEHKVGERVLGTDPATGKPVSVKIGRFGPMIQLGSGEGEEKPQFASLLKGQSVSTITLEEALKLFEFPRTLGEFEGEEVTVAIGRFGPYVKHQGKFVSIPKDMAPSLITLEEAEQLILEKRAAEAKRLVKSFDEDPDMQILNGRYGVYIAYKKGNYKIPKSVSDPSALTLEECRALVAEQDAKPKRSRKK